MDTAVTFDTDTNVAVTLALLPEGTPVGDGGRGAEWLKQCYQKIFPGYLMIVQSIYSCSYVMYCVAESNEITADRFGTGR